MSTVKEQFIQDLIRELNDINERELIPDDKKPIDVCFLVSVVDQKIEKYQDFMSDITKYTYCINGYEADNSGGYTNGKIRILIEKTDEEKESISIVDAYYDYCYFIEFLYDERMWGYCECSPEDEGYNEKHKCCGMGCDWYSPAFRLTKENYLGYSSWEGQEKDYWEYEKKFLANEKNKSEEVEKFQNKQRKKNIENRILELQKELEELKS
jgi:hypothetical protein